MKCYIYVKKRYFLDYDKFPLNTDDAFRSEILR